MCKELCGQCLYAYAYSHLLALCECHLFFCDYDAEPYNTIKRNGVFIFHGMLKSPVKLFRLGT